MVTMPCVILVDVSVGQAVVKGAVSLSTDLGWRTCPDYADLDIAKAKSFTSI